MSYELSNRESMKTFLSILKAFMTNLDRTMLFFYKNDLYLIQNFDKINDFGNEKLVLICLLKKTFFTNYYWPNNMNIPFAVEIEVSQIYKRLSLLRKKISNFSLEIPVLMEQTQFDLKSYSEIDLEMKYISSENSFSYSQKIKTDIIEPPNINLLINEINNFNKAEFWKRVLEFKSENIVNLTEFKNVFIDIIMNMDYVSCKQADVPVNYSLNIKKSKLEDYSNDVCMKDFEGHNKLQLHANKLLNYFQLCRDLKKNCRIYISKRKGQAGNHRILLPIVSNDDNSNCFYSFIGLLDKCEESDIFQNPFESNENSIRMDDEIEEENPNQNLNKSENSFSDIGLNELEEASEIYKINKNFDSTATKQNNVPLNISSKSFEIMDKKLTNPKQNSAISYFGFLNEPNEKDNHINKNNKENSDNKQIQQIQLELLSKNIPKRKDIDKIELENHEFKKIKPSIVDFNTDINKLRSTPLTNYGGEKIPKITSFMEKNKNDKSNTFNKNPFVKDPNYVMKHGDFFK